MKYLFLALLACACTTENPFYDSRLGPDGGRAGMDLRSSSSDMFTCAPGARRCQSRQALFVSQACLDGRWTDDRHCPENSMCLGGYCQPPPRMGSFEGKLCNRENDCFSQAQPTTRYACQPFVRTPNLQIEHYCALQIGDGNPGTDCTPPSGQGCRSGFCDEVPHPAGAKDENYCYRSCGIASDCPINRTYACLDARILVEQVPYSLGKSCIPQ